MNDGRGKFLPTCPEVGRGSVRTGTGGRTPLPAPLRPPTRPLLLSPPLTELDDAVESALSVESSFFLLGDLGGGGSALRDSC